MKYLFDTSAYSNLGRGDPAIKRLAENPGDIVLASLVIAELQCGFANGHRRQWNNDRLQRFLKNTSDVLYPDAATTQYYVQTWQYAKERGKALSHNDLWLAALALQYKLALVTYDNDFIGISQLENFRLLPL